MELRCFRPHHCYGLGHCILPPPTPILFPSMNLFPPPYLLISRFISVSDDSDVLPFESGPILLVTTSTTGRCKTSPFLARASDDTRCIHLATLEGKVGKTPSLKISRMLCRSAAKKGFGLAPGLTSLDIPIVRERMFHVFECFLYILTGNNLWQGYDEQVMVSRFQIGHEAWPGRGNFGSKEDGNLDFESPLLSLRTD